MQNSRALISWQRSNSAYQQGLKPKFRLHCEREPAFRPFLPSILVLVRRESLLFLYKKPKEAEHRLASEGQMDWLIWAITGHICYKQVFLVMQLNLNMGLRNFLASPADLTAMCTNVAFFFKGRQLVIPVCFPVKRTHLKRDVLPRSK